MKRRRIAFLLAIIVFAAIGLAGIARIYDQSKMALVVAAEGELRDTAHKAAEEANRLFEPAPLIVDRVLDARLPELDQLQLERILFAIASYPVHSYPQVNGVYVGTVDGSFFHVTDLVPPALSESGDVPPAYHGLVRRVLTRQGPITRDLWFYEDPVTKGWMTASAAPAPRGFDPRERPWFKSAVAKGGLTWGQPYMFASTQELGITLSAPIKDRSGALWGVVGIDFSLQTLANLVLDYRLQHVGSSGFMYIGDAEGHLIGHSQLFQAQKALLADPKLMVSEATSIHKVHLSGGDDLALFDAMSRGNGVVERVRNDEHELLGIRLPLDESLHLTDYIYVGQSLDAVAGQAISDLRRNIAILAVLSAIVALVAFYAVKLRSEVATRKRVEIALNQAKEVAEDATKAKSSFLAMMSHEIRTPMNGVMSMAEMLDQTDLSDDQRSMSSVIRASAGALLTIINDILDFSKIEAGKLDIEHVAFSLLDVVEGAGELMAGRAEDHGIDLIVDLDPALPDALIGDPARLRQVLLNLMGNAVKFTEVGAVTLRVTGSGQMADTLRLRFEVHDTGIGLTPEQRAKLFQPFVQADTSTSRKYGGTGLGLSICHRLCVMMDGAIGVDSVAGEGSTFWFEVPLGIAYVQPDRPAVPIDDAHIAAIGFTGRERDALAQLLAAAGIIDVTWADTANATESTVTGRVALVRVVPEDAKALALAHAVGRNTRIILLAPRGLASTMTVGADDGVFTALTLPIRRRRLWHVIAAALDRADLAQRQIVSTTGAIGWAPPPVEEARAARALVLVAEDNATNQIVIRRLLNQRGYAHEIGENGAVALELYAKSGYGILLTDFHMPEMDGFQLTAAIRERETKTGDHLPIVALTADALPGTEKLCLDSGMDGYLSKPIDSQALTAALEKFLPQGAALRRRPEAVPPVAAKPALPEINPEVLDLERLRETFGDIGPDALSFLSGFVADVPGMIAAIGVGLDARDRARARDAAHALKGAARSTGTNRLGDLASDIQDRLDDDDLDTAGFLYEALAASQDELRAALDALQASASARR